MLSRLHDERVFMSSDDVVFSASSSQALRRNGDQKRHRTVPTTRRMVHEDPLHEEEEESKSDASSEEHEAPADDELEDDDEEEDEEEKRRIAGLKFPLQSPRHIAASQSYIHRHRRRTDTVDGSVSNIASSPSTRRRHARKLLDSEDHYTVRRAAEREDAVMMRSNAPVSKELMRHKFQVQYHDRPMELVYLPTGQIRARDECPPGLQLPAMTDVRKLLEAPLSPETNEKVRKRVKSTLDESTTTFITRQTRDSIGMNTERWQRERPHAIQTNGKASKRTEAHRVIRASSPASSESEDENSPENSHSGKQRDVRRHEAVDVHTTNSRTNQVRTRVDSYNVPDSQTAPATTGSREETNAAVEDKTNVRLVLHDEPESETEYTDSIRRTTHSRNVKATTTRNLEVELQKEKKRVLQKMTLLLEEQGKTQALQQQLQMLQEKVASMEKELEASARREALRPFPGDSVVCEREERIRLLSEESRSKDDLIRRLQAQLEQSEKLNHERANRISPTDDDKVARLRQREAAIARQLEDLMNRVTTFHSQVECWKVNSREALAGIDKRSNIVDLMDQLWMDFPPFISSSESTSQKACSEGESSTITFLTKKLRQKEEELRLTHVKYVELKELCARQCIREADLQNFINEHRLRGNLVIRKANDTGASRAGPSQEQENKHVRPNAQRRTTNGYGHGNQESNSEDDDEDDAEGDRIVRRPKVFIDIKRSNQADELQQEQSPIEHVRLAPSPALVQRYRQQQQQQASVRHAAVRSSTGRTTHAATVASASRTLATTRQTRTATTQRRSATGVNNRTSAIGRTQSIMSKNASTRDSMASRRTSQPLTSRPWV